MLDCNYAWTFLWVCDLFQKIYWLCITFPFAVSPGGVYVATETFHSGLPSLSASLHLIELHRGTHFEQVPSEPLRSHTHCSLLPLLPWLAPSVIVTRLPLLQPALSSSHTPVEFGYAGYSTHNWTCHWSAGLMFMIWGVNGYPSGTLC